MQYKNTIEAISMQLYEVQKNIANWEVNDDIRNIDIDTALAKLRDIYDSLLSIRDSEKTPAPDEEKERVIEFTTEPPVEEPIIEKKEEIIQPAPEPDHITEIEPPKTASTEKKEAPPVEIKHEADTDHIHNSRFLGDSFNRQRPTLNEELSTHVQSEDLARQLKSRPITNLSAAIGLNEKFELLNNLFHGNKEAYDETIERLNAATNFNEAYNYLSGKLNWKMDDPLVQRLLELIRRKLIVKKQ